jgi:hypothetical protein
MFKSFLDGLLDSDERSNRMEIWDAYENIYRAYIRIQNMLGLEAVEEDENGEDIDGEEEQDHRPNEYDLKDDFINDEDEAIDSRFTEAKEAEEAEIDAEIELAQRELDRLQRKRVKLMNSSVVRDEVELFSED